MIQNISATQELFHFLINFGDCYPHNFVLLIIVNRGTKLFSTFYVYIVTLLDMHVEVVQFINLRETGQ